MMEIDKGWTTKMVKIDKIGGTLVWKKFLYKIHTRTIYFFLLK